jgi:hypothetical protein
MQLATEISIVVLLVGYVFSLTSISFPPLGCSPQAAHNLKLQAIHNHLGKLGSIPCVRC